MIQGILASVRRGVFIWLMMWSPVVGAVEDAGEAAVRFIDLARSGKLDLQPGSDTAMLPETSAEKRKQIARRLERLKNDIGDHPLELRDARVEGNMAAALVRATSGFDPSRIRVYAVGLVKRGDRWLAAPLIGSFENSGAARTREDRHRLDALRDWMLREQALDIERIKEEMAERMRREILRKLPAEELQAMDLAAAAQRLIDAFGQRDLPSILGLLGGLQNERPDDWSQRIHAVQAAMAGEKVSRQWHLLASDSVLRAVLLDGDGEESAIVTIGCLDPAAGSVGIHDERIELIVLPFKKSEEGVWRCDPPEDFYQPANAWEGNLLPEADEALQDNYAEKIRQIYPPQPQVDARGMLDALLGGLAAHDFAAVTRLLPPGGEGAGTAREAIMQAARVWSVLANPANSFVAIKPLLEVQGEHAAAVCHFFAPRYPERPELRVFHFKKSTAGWFWVPVPDDEHRQAMDRWVREQSGELQDSWRDRLLVDCVLLDKLPDSAIPDAAAANDVVRAWLAAIREGDAEAALRCTARLSTWDSPEAVLRILGYELAGRRKSVPATRILHHQRAGIWTAVGVHTAAGGDASFPLYPVIQTAEGPRILIEVDLFAAVKRGRDFLNKNAIARLEGMSRQYSEDLRKLLREHEKLVAEPTQ